MTKMFSKALLAKDLHTLLYAHQGYEIEHSSNKRYNGTTTRICNERETIEALFSKIGFQQHKYQFAAPMMYAVLSLVLQMIDHILDV
jgi:hypothetical protein